MLSTRLPHTMPNSHSSQWNGSQPLLSLPRCKEARKIIIKWEFSTGIIERVPQLSPPSCCRGKMLQRAIINCNRFEEASLPGNHAVVRSSSSIINHPRSTHSIRSAKKRKIIPDSPTQPHSVWQLSSTRAKTKSSKADLIYTLLTHLLSSLRFSARGILRRARQSVRRESQSAEKMLNEPKTEKAWNVRVTQQPPDAIQTPPHRHRANLIRERFSYPLSNSRRRWMQTKHPHQFGSYEFLSRFILTLLVAR